MYYIFIIIFYYIKYFWSINYNTYRGLACVCIYTRTSDVVIHVSSSLCYFFLLDISHFCLVLHIYTLEISRALERKKQIKIYLSQTGHPENYRQGILLCRPLRVEEKNKSEVSTISPHTEEFLNSLPVCFFY